MAEVVLEAVLGLLFENLNSTIQRELGLVRGVKADIGKLSATLSPISEVLADAEVKQIKSKAIQSWLARLKDAVYDAQAVLDDWAIAEADRLRHQPTESNATGRNLVWNSLLSLFNLKRLVFRYKIAKQIKEIRERFDGIAKEMSNFNFIKRPMDVEGSGVPPLSISPSRETSSASAELQMYGRDADKENIVQMLLENINSDHEICVCPIIGIGGLGKTTLAQFVCNDDRVQKHFEVKIWICVSDAFNVKRLLKEIVEFVTKERFDHDNLDVIRDRVVEQLRGKRFLLVLDDVWSDKQDEWNMLKNSLTCGAQGSSIVVTTRLETVASITRTIPEPYRLGILPEDHCWSLFRYYAFAGGKKLEKPNLIRIGQEIVRKCSGLPLAAKALGSLLRFKDEEKQWEQVRDSEIWDLEEEEDSQCRPKILSALRLSYNSLSPRARQCFAYCCLFPKDYEMSKEELVHLWLANGLLQAKKMEHMDVGEDVFSELRMHSFFQDVEEDVEDNRITFKIHDLLHDLASSVMEGEHSHIDPEVGKIRTAISNDVQDDKIRPRHVSIILVLPSQSSSIDDVSSIHPFLSSHQRHLRTLFLFLNNNEDGGMSSFDISAISCLKNVRALRIETSWKVEISLPLSFGDKLKHLRFVNLSDCGLSSLEAEFFNGMKNLQILDLSGNKSLKTLPDSMGKHLEHLRHLNLSGCGLSSLRDESFNGIKNLQFLNLSWNRGMKTIPDLIGNLEHLRYLNLSGNGSLNLLPESLGNLTELETLKMNYCQRLETLPQNTSRLCSLRHLENKECQRLRGMPSGVGQHLTRLEKLSMWVCGSGEIDNIEELRGLSLLGGSLIIILMPLSKEDGAHLDHVDEEVLTNKSNLSGLEIWFTRSYDDDDDDDANGSYEQALRVVKPPSNIEYLRIKGYSGWRFPDWMQMRDPQSSFPRVRRIELESIRNVEEWRLNWRDKECLPALQRLWIYGCPCLKSLPEELGNLTALKSLEIAGCRALVFVPSWLQKFTSLETLTIRGCERLVSMPQLQLMTSLTHLAIEDCPELKFVFHGLRHLTSLLSLHIQGCPGVVIPKGELDPLVALRGPSIRCSIDRQLIHDEDYSQSTTVSEIRGKQVLQVELIHDDDDDDDDDDDNINISD